MAFEQKISIKGINEAIAELNKLGPAGESAANKLRDALNKKNMGEGLDKLGESASTVFDKLSEGLGALTGSNWSEGGKLFTELAEHATTAGRALFGAFSAIRSGGSEAATGLKAVGTATKEAGEGAASSAGVFARVVGTLSTFAVPVVGIVTAAAAAAVAIGTLTYAADKAGAKILDLQYAAGATAEDTQRFANAADHAAISVEAMAQIAGGIRSGFREAKLASQEVIESWDVMKKRAEVASEAINVAETEQAESAIASAERIKDAEREKAEAAIEASERIREASQRVVQAKQAVAEAEYNVERAKERETNSAADEARSEKREERNEARSEEDFKDRRDDLEERYRSGKISTKDYEKEKKKINRDEQRAKEDQADRKAEMAERHAQLQQELQSHHDLVKAEESLQKAVEDLAKAIQGQKDTDRKTAEAEEKASRKVEDEKRKAPEEAEKAQKAVDRAYSQRGRIETNKQIFADQTQENGPALLRLFAGGANIGDPGGEAAYKSAKEKLAKYNKLSDSEQEAAVFGELRNFKGSEQEKVRLFNDIGGPSARRLSEHAGEVEKSFRDDIRDVNKENREAHFPDSETLKREGQGADSWQQTMTHGTDAVVHGVGGFFNGLVDFFKSFAPKAEESSTAIKHLGDAAEKAAQAIDAIGKEGGDASEEGAGHASGGLISGPGTSTSDSISARLSHGEYVVNADAVSKVGVPFMHALNSGQGFATGGIVDAFDSASGFSREARRFASGGLASAEGGHPVTFVIDGKTFTGFSGGKSAVDQLGRHAVMQQVGAIGRRPSHAR